MKFPQLRVALRGLDQCRDAAGEGGVDEYFRDMTDHALDPSAGRGIRDLGCHVLVETAERVGDQRELVRPVPVEGRLGDARAATASMLNPS
jgi:hypothetical protein